MPRAGLSHQRVVADAAAVADEFGLEQLTLAAVADRFGVTVPSLYKHISGLEALKRDLAVMGVRELTVAMSTAAVGRAGRDALHAVADAIRDYAHSHPGLYAASVRGPGPDDDELIAANEASLAIFMATLSGYGITDHSSQFSQLLDRTAPSAPQDERSLHDAIDAVRSLRAAIHGFVTLEATGGFGLRRSLDATYTRLIDSLDSAFRTWPTAGDATEHPDSAATT
jgi:AcrR family transcriptional regulator